MKDETLQKLIKLLHEGFMREFFGKEKTLKQLRAEARLRGFNDISKLTKTQLKNLLSKPQDLDQLRKRNLLVKAKKLGIKNATKLKKTQLINEIDDKVLKLVEEKQSSFKGFANQFTLELSNNVTFDPEFFLTAVKRKSLSKIQTQTNVKIILRANMEKTDLKTGERKNINSDQKMKLFLNQQTRTNCGVSWQNKSSRTLQNFRRMGVGGHSTQLCHLMFTLLDMRH